MFWRLKALLIKLEPVYATDSVPTGAADAFLAKNVNLRALQGQRITRDLDRPYLGAQPSLLINKHVALDFEIEVAGSGTIAVAPKYGTALRACGFAETITPATGPIEYDPVSTGFESVTIYLNIDGIRYKMTGVRGSVRIVLPSDGIPVYRFTFLGLFNAAADVALPVVDLSAFQEPLEVSDANTPTFTLHGFAAGVMHTLELDIGNRVAGRFLVGEESIRLSDRNGAGQVTIDAVALATFDPFARAVAHTLDAFQIVQGTVANNIVTIDAPKVQLGEPAIGQDAHGIVTWTIPLSLVPETGDDEIKITVS